jgi:hypothetical protein
MELNKYMNTRVDHALALPREDLLEKKQKMNLMETLAVKQPDRKVRITCATHAIFVAGADILIAKYIKDQLIAVLLASKVSALWPGGSSKMTRNSYAGPGGDHSVVAHL